jgi:hypothetical protein
MATPSKAHVAEALRKVIAGIKANLTGGGAIILGGQKYQPADLVKIFQAQLDAMDAVTALEAKLASARVTRGKAARRTAPVLRVLEEYLRGVLGGTNPGLMEYGFVPDAPRKVSVRTKAEAAAKARATRIARNTMGPKERLKVKGTVNRETAEAE